MSYRIVIPARLSSERLPEKPLADIAGKPMVVRTVEAASRSKAAEVLVATDDQRVAEAVEAAGYRAVMTRSDHPSGSDRIMEVVVGEGWSEDEVVLNVQGDEPLVPAEVLDQLAAALTAEPELASATLCEPVTEYLELVNPNVVKVVRGADERALYFSRAPIPYDREHFSRESNSLPDSLLEEGEWWRHIGVYAFRVWALRKFVSLPVARLERLERLEQLRLLENGLPMRVAVACRQVPPGVDTEDDLSRVRELLR